MDVGENYHVTWIKPVPERYAYMLSLFCGYKTLYRYMRSRVYVRQESRNETLEGTMKRTGWERGGRAMVVNKFSMQHILAWIHSYIARCHEQSINTMKNKRKCNPKSSASLNRGLKAPHSCRCNPEIGMLHVYFLLLIWHRSPLLWATSCPLLVL